MKTLKWFALIALVTFPVHSLKGAGTPPPPQEVQVSHGSADDSMSSHNVHLNQMIVWTDATGEGLDILFDKKFCDGGGGHLSKRPTNTGPGTATCVAGKNDGHKYYYKHKQRQPDGTIIYVRCPGCYLVAGP